jgi:hypothetical protein
MEKFFSCQLYAKLRKLGSKLLRITCRIHYLYFSAFLINYFYYI